LLILALLIGGIAGYYLFTHFWESSHTPPQVGAPYRVTQTTIRNTVSATGTVTSTEQTNLVFQASGQITAIYVKAGDQVKAGQPIAALDSRSAMIARDQARSSLTTAQAKLDALLAGATPDVIAAAQQSVTSAQSGITSAQSGITTAQSNVASSQANVTTSQATLTNAQNELAALLNGPTPTAIEQAQSSVDGAARSLQIAQYNYDQLVSHSNLSTRSEVTGLATAKQNYQTALANFLSKLTPPLSTNVAQAQTNLTLARNALQAAQLRNLQVQADPTAAISDKVAAQNSVTSAQAQVDQAQSDIQSLQQGTDQSDIAAASSQVDNARTALQSAQTSYNNLIALSDLTGRPEYSSLQSAVSQYETAKANLDNVLAPPLQTTVSSDQAAIQAAQAGVPSAQAGLASSQGGLNNAQGGLNTAQATLNAAQAKLAQTLAPPLPTDVTQAQEAVRTAQLALQQAQLTLDNQTLVAPFDGVIISVPVNIGQQVSSATTVTTLTNPNALEVDANVDETSVTQLKVGQPATVTLDALPGQTFNAVVSAVTPSGTTQQGVVVFPIVFRLDTNGQTVPAGASANITVTTAITPNVIAVPARYVHVQSGKQVVDVLENGKRVSKPVTTGVTNGQLTQITSGLQVGEIAIPPEQNRQGATFGAGGNVGGGAPPGGP
jgi:HlyD family secretion protein